jgi:site-specific DNA recombinase
MQLKAAIYGRVSTDRQSELSIEAQIEACERYCEQQGWDVYDHYCDFGLSATSADKRPALQRMIRDAKAQCFNVVVAHKVDRAFRNMRDYENIKYELQKLKSFSVYSGLLMLVTV